MARLSRAGLPPDSLGSSSPVVKQRVDRFGGGPHVGPSVGMVVSFGTPAKLPFDDQAIIPAPKISQYLHSDSDPEGSTILKELDLATLRRDLPAFGLIAGDIGTVVEVYANGEAYEVEFLTTGGGTLAVETLRADQVDPVPGRSVLHAGKLAAI